MMIKHTKELPILGEFHTDLVKILLVDDRAENLLSLESLLRKKDEAVSYLFASSGEEALKIALQEDLALILLDVQMPGMNGYEVARYLQNFSKTKDIPIIFVTAIDQNSSHVVEGFEAGAVDFLFKPLHPFITKAKVSAFVRLYLQKKALENATQSVINLNRQLEDKVMERTKDLTRINNDLENFIYTASHDLKAPIHNIEGLLQLLYRSFSEEANDSARVATVKNLIEESINRFKNTLIDLMEIAKAQSEEATDKDKISFQDLLGEVKLTVREMIENYSAEINSDFSKAPEISFSRKSLRSILYNLISNAVKYSSPDRKPVVNISTSSQGGYLVLSVQDNGLGLKKEDQEKVFTMFKRLHTHVEGSGVGMAIVKRITENSGGRIELESELGKGSVFRIFLKAEH